LEVSVLKTYVGRGAGAFIENQFFAAPQTSFLLICSPWISPKYAQYLIDFARRGINVKIITGDSNLNTETLRLFREATTPPRDWLGRTPKDWTPPLLDMIVIHEHDIHAKIYAKEGYAVVGSANLTEQGLWKNAEHIVIFEGEEAEQIINDFGTLYQLYKEHPPEGAASEIVWEVKGIKETITGILKKVKFSLRPTCPKCGRPVQRGSKFCPNCGTKLE
jgi:phosphatidylserine/phosphatidylglycerophosphate/cardiolipin synthase-like enzyme